MSTEESFSLRGCSSKTRNRSVRPDLSTTSKFLWVALLLIFLLQNVCTAQNPIDFALITDQWKLVSTAKGGTELFNLNVDVAEKNDVKQR